MAGETRESVREDSTKIVERVYARAFKTADQDNLPGDAWTKVLLNTVGRDLGGNFDIANSKFVVPVTGLYLLLATITFNDTVADKRYITAIYNNGASIVEAQGQSSIVNNLTVNAQDFVFLKAGDELELYAYSNAGSGIDTVDVLSGSKATYLIANLISKAGTRQ